MTSPPLGTGHLGWQAKGAGMLDIVTLRVTFTLVAVSMLVLFYVATYRVTRAPFCGWWCVSLALFLTSASLWLLNGTAAQAWANPVGNAAGVGGAVAAWAGARSLHLPRLPWPVLALSPILAGLAGALDDPAGDEWSGGLAFLALMTLNLGLATRELWLARRKAGGAPETYASVTALMAGASALVAVFYVGRTVAYALVGPDHWLFADWFGSAPTTLLTTVLLVAVSFSMSSLSQEQYVHDLHRRATRDDLTGALQRAEFLELATRALRQHGRAVVVMADLDNFKQVNDDFGHSTGDRVLHTFVRVCHGATRSGDLVARFGGEEFVLFLPGARREGAEILTHAIARMMRIADPLHGARAVTASFGTAVVDDHTDLATALVQADEALYRAKALGRDRAVHYQRG